MFLNQTHLHILLPIAVTKALWPETTVGRELASSHMPSGFMWTLGHEWGTASKHKERPERWPFLHFPVIDACS